MRWKEKAEVAVPRCVQVREWQCSIKRREWNGILAGRSGVCISICTQVAEGRGGINGICAYIGIDLIVRRTGKRSSYGRFQAVAETKQVEAGSRRKWQERAV